MVHYKKLFSLDPECLEILKEEPIKKQSEFIRQAIKHYNANRGKKHLPFDKGENCLQLGH